MATIKLLLHKNWKHKDNTYPLVLQIIHNRRKKIIYTGYQIEEANFNSILQKVQWSNTTKLSTKQIGLINRNIQSHRHALLDRIAEFERLNIDFSVKDLEDKPLTHHPTFILEYMSRQINLKLLGRRDGIAQAYKNTRSSFGRFLGMKDIEINQITSLLIKRYQAFLLSRGLSENTVAYYMRNLKTIYNCMLQDGCNTTSDSPFRGIRTTICKTIKRAITREELIRIAKMEFDPDSESHIEFARDIFLFSYYTCGMAFVDIAYLKKSNIESGVIVYYRHKSKQQIRVSVIEPLKKLIDKYQNTSEYVMPILDANQEKSEYEQYRLALARINKNLKITGDCARLDYRLTTYMARHTWATQVKMLGTPVSIISQGLGHTSENTTRIYLQEFDSKVVDSVNSKVSILE